MVRPKRPSLTSLEVCAGAGGTALGLHRAGFRHVLLVDNDEPACETLRQNGRRYRWRVENCDLRELDARPYRGVDLLSGGVPCPPFSVAGKQLGAEDERDLFPAMIELVRQSQPKALLIENVRGILKPAFDEYRMQIEEALADLKTDHGHLKYEVLGWEVLNASDFGVPQLRPRIAMVALKPEYAAWFRWPRPRRSRPKSVGEVLYQEMASRGWEGAADWRDGAKKIAPTLVGGSKKHGGPDLGPTRAKKAWAQLGVDGHSIAEEPPEPGFKGTPRLTVRMCARLQGFPKSWEISGTKTQAYRQVGNAFPPPVAKALGVAIRNALLGPEEEATRGEQLPLRDSL